MVKGLAVGARGILVGVTDKALRERKVFVKSSMSASVMGSTEG